MPAAVIFDNDGLTLDTEHTWTRAETALYARYGVRFTLDHKREMLGTSGAKSALSMERHLGQPGRGRELQHELRELVHGELDGTGVSAMPGARELIEALHERGVPLGLATNSGREFATRALRGAGLLDRFGAVVSREQLAKTGWPRGAPGRNALDVHMLRLRRRIAPVGLAIKTVRSRGYLLEADSEAAADVAVDDRRRHA